MSLSVTHPQQTGRPTTQKTVHPQVLNFSPLHVCVCVCVCMCVYISCFENT